MEEKTIKLKFFSKLPDGADLKLICKKISGAFSGEPHLLRVSPEDLARSFNDGLSMIILAEDGEPIGHTRLVQLTEPDSPSGEWFELGGTWIHPSYRGLNLNARLYQEFLPRHAEKNILATTTNKASLAVGKSLGFVMIPRKFLPGEVWRASCVCPVAKTGTQSNADCKLAWGEEQACDGPCWFRVTVDTARRIGYL